MDGGEVEPPSSIKPYYYQGMSKDTRTIGQYVSELCAYYMALGMPREEFFHGDRYACDDYERAWEAKLVNDNKMLHLQGIYNHAAFGSVLSGLFAEKGKKGTPYLEYPLPITESERAAEKERKIMHTLDFVRGRKRNG